jgi:hypothetical protein
MDDPKRIVVKFHRTHIARFYPDGSHEVNTGWRSSTTLARLRDYSSAIICQKHLISVNGYRPFTERAYFVSTYADRWVPFNSHGEYIRIDPDGHIDRSTVKPWTSEVITHPKELRKVMKHLSKCNGILLGYAKLADNEQCFQDGHIEVDKWFMKHVDVPLEDIKLDPKPVVFVPYRSSLKLELEKVRDAIRWDIARQRGWTGRREIMDPR